MWSSEQPYGLRTITYFTEKETDIEEVKQFPKVTQRTSSIWGRHVLKALWETNTIYRHQACLPQASFSLFPHWYRHLIPLPSCGCCSVLKSCLTLWDPMDCSKPGFPVSISPGVCSNSCPLNRWCHPTISSSVTPFFSCPQSFPALGSFPVSQLFASDGQSIGASASASVLPVHIQGWFPLRMTGLISLLSKQ